MKVRERIDREDSYGRFVGEVLAAGRVWAIAAGRAYLTVVAENDEQSIVPFWSSAARAATALEGAPDGFSDVTTIPLPEFLATTLGRLQEDDVLVGPNYTDDLEGLEIEPRELFETLREQMSDGQRAELAASLEDARLLRVGHPPDKLEARAERFARIVLAEEDTAFILVREDGPVRIPGEGAARVPIWSSEELAQRARLFNFAASDAIDVLPVDVRAFLDEAERRSWKLAVEATVDLASEIMDAEELREFLDAMNDDG